MSAQGVNARAVPVGALVAAGLVLAGLVGLLAGPTVFAVVVVVAAALVMLDVTSLLARARVRPVLAVAAVPGLALPLVASATPLTAWRWVPGWLAAAFLIGCVLVIVFGRRERVGAALGATIFVSLVVGVGAASLLALRALPDGFRWVAGLGIAVAIAEGGLMAVPPLRRRLSGQGRRMSVTRPAAGVLAAAAPVAALVVAGLVVALVLAPPFGAASAAIVMAVSLLAAGGGAALCRALRSDTMRLRPARGAGQLFAAADAVAYTAPAVYVAARLLSE
jgi:hypothetical protein